MATRESVLFFSHLRWGSGDRRPQQLARQCARERTVVYIEEPVWDAATPALELTQIGTGVLVAVPHLVLSARSDRGQHEAALRHLIDRIVFELGDPRPLLWYCTPTAVGACDHLQPTAIVYDCVAELQRLVEVSPKTAAREQWLFEHADVVFTDCHSLCRYKRRTTRHPNIYPFPSSVDVRHFGRAREPLVEPPDQDDLPRPRIGYCGTIDARIDFSLLAELAAARPDLQLVLLGPIIGIDPSALPVAPNMHWLGARPHSQIPSYLAGWDVALLPFVRSEATRWLAPVEPAETLAAGKPVVSTAIANVVEPYGRSGLVWIADGAGEVVDAIDEALASDRHARVTHADMYLFEHSWRQTWATMWRHVERTFASRTSPRTTPVRRTRRAPASSVVAAER